MPAPPVATVVVTAPFGVTVPDRHDCLAVLISVKYVRKHLAPRPLDLERYRHRVMHSGPPFTFMATCPFRGRRSGSSVSSALRRWPSNPPKAASVCPFAV